jgi:8-oxo-dGTP diphosphatase
MPSRTTKVYAYITNRDRLLDFTQPDYPEAGTQVPGGTVEAGEDPDVAVLREAFEETSLTGLICEAFLGVADYDMSEFGRDEIAHRHYDHLCCPGDPPETWRHWERHPSDADQPEIAFDFFWVPLSNVPALEAGLDQMLPRLRAARHAP